MTTASRGPYRGLDPFTESDEDVGLFFGRAGDAEIISSNLLASRLTVVCGPTGVGKSSVLRAGVVNPLRRRAQRVDRELGEPGMVVVIVDEWHGDPSAAIDDAVAREIRRLGDADTEATGALSDRLLARSSAAESQIMLILDQFEEYFLYHGPDDPLTLELPRLVSRGDLSVRLLLSLREDALARLDRFKGRMPMTLDLVFRLRHLDEAAAREAIEGPAEHWNASGAGTITLSPGLAERLVEQLSEQLPGATGPRRVETAYLQLVMTRLWETEARLGSATLHEDTLDKLGGAREVVSDHVHAALSRLRESQQGVASDALRFLITPAGTKIALTAADLSEWTGTPEREVAAICERLSSGDARILRSLPGPHGAPRFELFHDVLAGPVLDWRAARRARRLERRARRVVSALVVVGLLAAVFLVWILLPRNTVVPNVVGSTSAFSAEKRLVKADLVLAPNIHHTVDQRAVGSVVAQTPAWGDTVRKGSAVSVVIAVPSDRVHVPRVVGLTAEQADRALRAAGLTLGRASPQPVDPAKLIASQIPAADEVTKRGTPVDIFFTS